MSHLAPSRYPDRYAVSILLILSFPVLIGLVLFNWPSDGALQVSLCAGLLLLLLPVTYWYVREGGIFQPLAIVLVSTGVGFFGKLVYMILGYGTNPMIDDFLLLGKGIAALLPGVTIISVSLVCLLMFYALPRRSAYCRPVSIVHHFSGQRAFILGLFFFCLGLGFFLAYVIFFSDDDAISGKRFSAEGALPSDRFMSIGYYLFKAAFLIKISFYIFLLASMACINRESKIITVSLTVVSFLLSIIISFYFSNRVSMVILFLDMLIIVYLMRGRISWRFVLPMLVFVVSIFFLISALRSQAGAGKTLMDHLFGGRYFFELSKNAHLYNFFASGGSLISDSGSLGGSGFLKAYLNLGRVAGGQVILNGTSGVPLGFPAELFAFGGYPLLLTGMASAGFFLRKLAQMIARPVVRDYVIVIYAMITTRAGVFLFNNGLGVTVYQIILDLIPFLCMVLLVRIIENTGPSRSALPTVRMVA